MKIPDKLKVLGHEYSIIKTNRIRQGMATTGSCCTNLLEIELEPDAPESKMAETFLHEIFEAIRFHLEINEDLEHSKMSAMCELLFSVIRDNNLDFRKGRV